MSSERSLQHEVCSLFRHLITASATLNIAQGGIPPGVGLFFDRLLDSVKENVDGLRAPSKLAMEPMCQYHTRIRSMMLR